MAQSQDSTTADNVKAVVDDDQSSKWKMVKTKMKGRKGDKTALGIKQMTLDHRIIPISLQKNAETTSLKDEQIDEDIKFEDDAIPKEELNLLTETEQMDEDLKEEFDIGGTIELTSMNVIDSDITSIIDQAFRTQKKKCTRLILRDNALTSDGVKTLVDELIKVSTCLKNLTLSSNPAVGDVGIEHLVRLLKTNRTITILALHHTGITNRGVQLLADLLCGIGQESYSSIENLYISFNKLITDDSLETLVQILEQNQTLKVFSLQRCSLSDKARRKLRQVVAKKKKKKLIFAD